MNRVNLYRPSAMRIVTMVLFLIGCLFTLAMAGPSDLLRGFETGNPTNFVGGQSRRPNIVNLYGMTFIYIPPGEFFMGSPLDEAGRKNNEQQHNVVITDGFYMMDTEVTQKQWMAVMGANPSAFDRCGPDCPVENVSWVEVDRIVSTLNSQVEKKEPLAMPKIDAIITPNKLKKRETDETAGTTHALQYALPTEAQWEYACRAGSQGWFHFRGDSWRLAEYGWYKNNSGGQPHAVAQKEANPFGLFDMHGNVWEWCRDFSGPYPSKPALNPKGPAKGALRIARGGSWYYPALAARCANRLSLPPQMGNYNVGFRLVLIDKK